MSKALVIYLSIFFCSITVAQNCHCDIDSLGYNDRDICATIKFDNQTELLWDYNCDSSWLSFVNVEKKKTTLFSMEMIDLTRRLGYASVYEFKNAFIMEYKVISGCCTPPEFHLFDKSTGNLKGNLGHFIYVSEDKKKPFAIGIIDSLTNKKTDSRNFYIQVYNVDKNKEYFIKLPTKEIMKTIEVTGEMNIENIFSIPIINDFTITVQYYEQFQKSKTSRSIKTLKLDLNTYR